MSNHFVSLYYQADLLLKGKRKSSLYNVLSEEVIELKEVSLEETEFFGFSKNTELGFQITQYTNTSFYMDYRLYDGILYEPYIKLAQCNDYQDNKDTASIVQDIKNSLYNETLYFSHLHEYSDIYEFLKNNQNNIVNLTDNVINGVEKNQINKQKILFTNCLPEITLETIVDETLIKKINSDNLQEKRKQLIKLASNNLLLINGQLYKKSIGPVVSNNGYKNYVVNNDAITKQLDISDTNFNRFSFISGIYLFSLQNYSKNKETDLSRYKNNEIQIFIKDINKLFLLNHPLYGKFIFDNICNIENTFQAAGLEYVSEEHVLDFLQKISEILNKNAQKIYPNYGDCFFNAYQKCKESNYTLDNVIEFFNILNTKNSDLFFPKIKIDIDEKLPKGHKKKYPSAYDVFMIHNKKHFIEKTLLTIQSPEHFLSNTRFVYFNTDNSSDKAFKDKNIPWDTLECNLIR